MLTTEVVLRHTQFLENQEFICLTDLARCVATGDKIIIIAYADMTPEEAKTFEPKVVFVDDDNQISRCTNYERHGRLEDM